MRYYIADLHFFHDNLNRTMDCRGFSSVETMNGYIVEQWNRKVKPGKTPGTPGVFYSFLGLSAPNPDFLQGAPPLNPGPKTYSGIPL